MDGAMLLNVFAITVVYFLVFMPRFNKWPKGYANTIYGSPFGYIDSMTFILFSLAYLSTYLLFAFAFSQIPNFRSLIPMLDQASGNTFDLNALNTNFTIALVALTAAINIPIIDRTDSRWRSYLLDIARIPREALILKTSIVDSINNIDHLQAYQDYIASEHIYNDDTEFWQGCIADYRSEVHSLAIRTISGLHLISKILDLDPKHQDIEYLSHTKRRLKELSTIIPRLTRSENDLTPGSYDKELYKEIEKLSETYACYVVKKYSSTDDRYRKVRDDGFPIAKQPPKESSPLVPIILGATVLFVFCALLTLVGLHYYDAMGLPRADLPWFTKERFYQWTTGSWVSFAMAFGFGIFFNKILDVYYGSNSAMTYLLAFIFSTLGACFFFIIARDEFKPHFIWLTINFGLLSSVTIASINKAVTDKNTSIRTALKFGFYYGMASTVFSAALQLHAADLRFVMSYTATAATYGLLRGFVIGFFVAYLFIEFNRVQTVADRRLRKRLQAGDKVKVGWHGIEVPAYLENLSNEGAQLKIFSSSVSVGDELGLELAGGKTRRGFVQWMRGNLAGIRFEGEQRSPEKAA